MQCKHNNLKDTGKGGDNQLQEGEKHVPQLKWDNGSKCNYSGPGTKLMQRLKRGDKPVTIQDQAAQAHDIRYELGKNYEDMRAADEKMKSALLKKSSIFSPIQSLNNLVGYTGIKLKNIGEDLGIFKKDQFTNVGGEHSEEDKKLLTDKLQELEKEGFGKHKKKLNLYGYGNHEHYSREQIIQCDCCIPYLQRDIQKHHFLKGFRQLPQPNPVN